MHAIRDESRHGRTDEQSDGGCSGQQTHLYGTCSQHQYCGKGQSFSGDPGTDL